MNQLTGSRIGVANKLFSTLSPTTRKITCGKYEVLLTDTVGFIRKLPHQLVEAFMATLEQVQEADLLIHVVDISAEDYRHHIRAVKEVLEELELLNKPIIRVYNKIDNSGLEPRRQQGDPPAVFVSALNGLGMEELKKEVEVHLDKLTAFIKLRVPQNRQDIINSLYKRAHVFQREYQNNDVILKCNLDKSLVSVYERYIVE
jgi:GTP-binding protein HflX